VSRKIRFIISILLYKPCSIVPNQIGVLRVGVEELEGLVWSIVRELLGQIRGQHRRQSLLHRGEQLTPVDWIPGYL
jgi:hypothetical protein